MDGSHLKSVSPPTSPNEINHVLKLGHEHVAGWYSTDIAGTDIATKASVHTFSSCKLVLQGGHQDHLFVNLLPMVKRFNENLFLTVDWRNT